MANRFCMKMILIVVLVLLVPLSLFSCKEKETYPVPAVPTKVIPYTFVEDSSLIIEMGTYPQTLETEYTVEEIKGGVYYEDTGYYMYYGNYYEILTAYPCTQDMTPKFSNGEVCEAGKEYAFKVEPIRWKVINKILNEENYFVYSNKILDTTIYQKQAAFGYDSDYQNYYLYKDNVLQVDKELYANNYEHSILRLKLQGFYSKAFSSANKSGIYLTSVKNSSPNYGPYYEPSHQDDTADYVFALSSSEATNSKYGYTSEEKAKRLREPTDYALAKGVFCITKSDGTRYGWTWTRTAADKSNRVYFIDTEGNLDKTIISSDDNYKIGFAPAMRVIILDA